MNTIRLLSAEQVHHKLLIEASKACPKDKKIAWMNDYLKKGGTIPNKNEHTHAPHIPTLLRENRDLCADKFASCPASINPMIIDLLYSQKITTSAKTAIDLGGGNSSLALFLLKNGWNVTVVDPSKAAFTALTQRVLEAGFGTLLHSRLRIVSSKMEDYNFPKNVGLITAQSSLPYCDPLKVEAVCQNIFQSLDSEGVFFANFFNYPTNVDEETGRYQEMTCRLRLGIWLSTPSLSVSLLKNTGFSSLSYSIDGEPIASRTHLLAHKT